ncbi:acyltransferase family protein [Cellulomonas palmilytica]|uniref:acyltransferase family protein n=1 Tax=Cellulomonas palmilytica TaxID=2608402 RepID=UPI001F384ABD|nr:acyltransferase family protein [Cellulomonas palmilytica]
MTTTTSRPESGEQTAPEPTTRRRTSGHIRGLDGLRAIAVVVVIAYHLWPATVPGGFLGVDVFFVVSGFLITTLLLRRMGGGSGLALRDFWVRRARRLLPALGLVLVVGTLAARLVEPDLLVGVRRQWLGAWTFSTNWLEIAAGSSYFDSTQPELFQPFWSLAIEEQFYVLWPLVLAGLVLGVAALHRRDGARAVAFAVGAAAVASAVAMAVMYTPGDDPTRVYYGTPTHAFGLLAGAALAIAVTGRPHTGAAGGGPARASGAARALPVLGLLVLGVLVALLRDDDPFTYRGGIVLGSLAALALVAGCAAEQPSGLLRVLELRPVVWVGDRSYGLYLWHWPVILVVGAAFGDAPGSPLWWRVPVVSLALTFVLAHLSHRFVEMPVRRDGFRAVVARAGAALRGPRPGARLAGVLASVLVLGAVVSVATAPAVTSTQKAIEAAQREIERRAQEQAEAGDGSGDTGEQDGDPKATEPKDPDAKDPEAEDPAKDPEQDPDAKDPEAGTGGGQADPAGPGRDAQGAIDGSGVVGFGDSVLSGAAPALFDAFPQISIDAKPIRKWLDAPEIVRKAKDAGGLRPVVVLNFGTNGGFKFDGSVEAFEETLDVIGPDRQVLVLTVVGISYWVDDANAKLVELASSRPNVHVVDWHAYVAEHPGLLHSDKTHPNMKGIVEFADLLRESLEKLDA